MRKHLAILLISGFLPLVDASPARSQAQALPAAVSACYANPVVCTVVVGGVGTWILIRNSRKTLCTWDGCQSYTDRVRERGAEGRRQEGRRDRRTRESQMLEDPESSQETWDDKVWATSRAQAERQCRNIAERNSDRSATIRLDSVDQVSKRPNKAGKYLYQCNFTSFIRSYGNYGNDDRN